MTSFPNFDTTGKRGLTWALWRDLVEATGSSKASLGQDAFIDFQPYLGSDVGIAVSSDGSSPTTTLQTDRFGVINITESAGANECVGIAVQQWFDVQNTDVLVIGARIEQNADANTPLVFVGWHDGTNPDDVFSSGAIANGSNEDTLGLRWNNDETIDIVSVDDGTLTVLKDDIGATVERDSGVNIFELRVEWVSSTQVRLTPAVNNTVYHGGAVTVASTSIPENPMKPTVAGTVASVTAPSLDIDYIRSADKV